MIYLLQTETGIQYPYTKAMLPSTFPNVSFPALISDDCAASHGCFPVVTIDRPDHDPRTERLVEGTPEQQEDGSWQQVLTVRDATEEEIAAWDASNRPAPDWGAFKGALLASAGVNGLLTAAMAVIPAAALALPAVLMALADGRGGADFQACWTALVVAGLVSEDLRTEIFDAAVACYLPDEICQLIAGD